MKSLGTVLFLCFALLPSVALAKKSSDYPATYAGGSLPLNHNRVRAELGTGEVIFIQHNRRIAVPAKNITEISCGAEARRRLMHLGEAEDYYIGVTWSTTGAAPSQVLLRLSRREYGQLLAALEQLTGVKAIDTNQVPTVVRYSS